MSRRGKNWKTTFCAHSGGKIGGPIDFNTEIGPGKVETGSTSSRTVWAGGTAINNIEDLLEHAPQLSQMQLLPLMCQGRWLRLMIFKVSCSFIMSLAFPET